MLTSVEISPCPSLFSKGLNYALRRIDVSDDVAINEDFGSRDSQVRGGFVGWNCAHFKKQLLNLVRVNSNAYRCRQREVLYQTTVGSFRRFIGAQTSPSGSDADLEPRSLADSCSEVTEACASDSVWNVICSVQELRYANSSSSPVSSSKRMLESLR